MGLKKVEIGSVQSNSHRQHRNHLRVPVLEPATCDLGTHAAVLQGSVTVTKQTKSSSASSPGEAPWHPFATRFRDQSSLSMR